MDDYGFRGRRLADARSPSLKSTPSYGSPSKKSGDGEKSQEALEQRLITLCQKGEWQGMDATLKYLDYLTPNLADETNGYTPLMYAIKDNKINKAEKFITLGINVNAKSKDGMTAFHFAAAHGREDIVKLLLSRKADPCIVGGPKGQLPAHILCSRSSGSAVPALHLILRAAKKEIRMVTDREGNIPFFMAVETGSHGMVRELLGSCGKEQVTAKRPGTGDTALHMATRRRDLELLKLIMEQGAHVNAQNNEGLTPLHLCVLEGDEHILNFLHGVKAKPDIVDNKERTALHIAAEKGLSKIVEILTDKFKASIFQRTKDAIFGSSRLSNFSIKTSKFAKKYLNFCTQYIGSIEPIHTH